MKLNKLGMEIEIKDKLSVRDMFKINNLNEKVNDELDMLTNIVSLALVEPKMTPKEIEELDGFYVNDLAEIVEIVTTKKD